MMQKREPAGAGVEGQGQVVTGAGQSEGPPGRESFREASVGTKGDRALGRRWVCRRASLLGSLWRGSQGERAGLAARRTRFPKQPRSRPWLLTAPAWAAVHPGPCAALSVTLQRPPGMSLPGMVGTE